MEKYKKSVVKTITVKREAVSNLDAPKGSTERVGVNNADRSYFKLFTISTL